MSIEALNRVEQTHLTFKKMIEPLKQFLDLSFGYMIVFEDGYYYKLQEDLVCLKNFVECVDQGSIFCARNVTSCMDGSINLNFTLWPEVATCEATRIFHTHNISQGVSVSRINKDYTEIYYFNTLKSMLDWQKFFIRNKQALVEFIRFFDSVKEYMSIPLNHIEKNLFKFKNGFDSYIPVTNYYEELDATNKFISSLKTTLISGRPLYLEEEKLTAREINVLSIISRGYTYKSAAQKLNISPRTIEYHMERIKAKTNFNSRAELISFFELHFN